MLLETQLNNCTKCLDFANVYPICFYRRQTKLLEGNVFTKYLSAILFRGVPM